MMNKKRPRLSFLYPTQALLKPRAPQSDSHNFHTPGLADFLTNTGPADKRIESSIDKESIVSNGFISQFVGRLRRNASKISLFKGSNSSAQKNKPDHTQTINTPPKPRPITATDMDGSPSPLSIAEFSFPMPPITPITPISKNNRPSRFRYIEGPMQPDSLTVVIPPPPPPVLHRRLSCPAILGPGHLINTTGGVPMVEVEQFVGSTEETRILYLMIERLQFQLSEEQRRRTNLERVVYRNSH
ncbi:hypothetical protein CLU79DRAFT_755239 [Phycomyces nitens]|nr:hypothetical protein CLU79DRAFT_755239 [Phycomyces nitens]